MSRSALFCCVIGLTLCASAARAQTDARPRRANMQAMADALGVRCTYCHVEKAGVLDYREDHPMKGVARLMIAMTNDINAAIASAVLKPDSDIRTVTCQTCHRGVADPRPLDEILFDVIERDSPSAATTRYRDLRGKYFGRDIYDFSEMTLVRVAQRFAERSPSTTLQLAELNLEFFPRSASTYIVMGIAATRMLDDAAAITHFEKALEFEPAHGIAQGYLQQLRQYQRRRAPESGPTTR